MDTEHIESEGLLSLLGRTIYSGLNAYKDEMENSPHWGVCYGKNHTANLQRAIVEYYLYNLGQSRFNRIASIEAQNDRFTSVFLKMTYDEKLVLTTFRLPDRRSYPKQAIYRTNYSKSNQLYLIPEVKPEEIIDNGLSYGVICFGIDQESMFAYIGYPNDSNTAWLKVTRLEDYFVENEEPVVDVDEVLPKLKIVQVSENGVS